ncbi:MAG: hypothetical protein AABZ55_08950, partial [Bdellovibrionota bacterium]
MKKIILSAIALLFLSLSSFGLSDSIFGKWEMLIKNNNVDYTLSMNIVEDATTFFLTCKGEGLSAVA